MIDITKEEFWGNIGEIEKKVNRESKIKNFIIKNKIITALLISLSLLMTLNTILIYNFFRVLINI